MIKHFVDDQRVRDIGYYTKPAAAVRAVQDVYPNAARSKMRFSLSAQESGATGNSDEGRLAVLEGCVCAF